MSVQFKITDQILRLDDVSDVTESVVHKYDAFLNLLHGEKYGFLRDAVRESIRFLCSGKYPDLESLARENWENNSTISKRYDKVQAFLDRMPLRARKAASLDIATGGGKSFAMYGIAAIALAEGIVDRVLVLCPSITIEEGLLKKFTTLAGSQELAAIMKELGAHVAIPAIKRGDQTILPGDICIENVHAVYSNAGSSIADSFRGHGNRTLVLNDEAHHLFSPDASGEASLKKWLEFLLQPDYGFRYLINVTGTPFTGDEYFPDVIFRFGLKQAIEAGVVKKPDYVIEETFKKQSWDKIYEIHDGNKKFYEGKLRPISIVVTKDIAECVEQWNNLINFLMQKENLSRQESERKAIWVTSGIPSMAVAKNRVTAAYGPRDDKDSPEKRRIENLTQLKTVDEPGSQVEWIVSVSMLTEGWDVKNVFQIVPHDSRAFGSRLLIAQVLGRGLRVPRYLEEQPLVKITNHEAWSSEIEDLLKDVLEIENTLSWGYDSRRDSYLFPLHNLSYELVEQTVETKKEKATDVRPTLKPQSRGGTQYVTFKESGEHEYFQKNEQVLEIDSAVRLLRAFIAGKDAALAELWPVARIKTLIQDALKEGGYETDFLSRENLTLVQQSFGPLLRPVDRSHPRLVQAAKTLLAVDYRDAPIQTFSESRLKESGCLYMVAGDTEPFNKEDGRLWEQYSKWIRMAGIDPEVLNDDIRQIISRLHEVESTQFKTPANVLYASHEPERQFSKLLFHNSELIESFIKTPDKGCYSFPYSYKPAKAGKTHPVNEQFNPDFFILLKETKDILVVEIKQDGDGDSNRNKAKFRDGKHHFKRLNEELAKAGEPWKYYFYFLSPADYPAFFDQIRNKAYSGWNSGLMVDLVSVDS